MGFSLAPGLLIAMPNLADSVFHRSVILLCNHDAEGAFGLVINQPLDLPMQAVCADANVPWTGNASQMAYRGGPVDRQRGWLLHPAHRHYDGSQAVTDALSVTPSREGLAAYGREPDGAFRLLLGYAGWGAGQLDREVLEGAWLTAPVPPTLPFEPAACIWELALASVGVNPTHLVEAPGHRH